jgi:5'(3')-deoxyribonucleotidase
MENGGQWPPFFYPYINKQEMILCHHARERVRALLNQV